MDIGIALDGEGRLGQPSAVTSVALAADRLGYGSVWCVGPWAATLVGAVAVVTARVRIGLESRAPAVIGPARAAAGDRLVVVERLRRWPPATGAAFDGDAATIAYQLDVGAGAVVAAAEQLRTARTVGLGELVVRLVDDPDLDTALAVYAELGELVDGSVA